jgi:hypothetical protein
MHNSFDLFFEIVRGCQKLKAVSKSIATLWDGLKTKIGVMLRNLIPASKTHGLVRLPNEILSNILIDDVESSTSDQDNPHGQRLVVLSSVCRRFR